jgi:hypothetical protein
MKRLIAVLLCLVASAGACSDDQVVLRRGPLGPARYRVEVQAEGPVAEVRVSRRATLRVAPRSSGAALTLRLSGEDVKVINADIRLSRDGSVTLDRIRGASVEGSGQTDLASLAGQLNPPLPDEPVRLGEVWSSTQRITTRTLRASLRTRLHIVRFRRISAIDAAEFEGEVSGRLSTTGDSGSFEGRLSGQTRIVWAVEDGRVVAAETSLVWSLSTGDRVTLETNLEPN